MEDYSMYKAIDGELWIFVGCIDDEDMYSVEDLELLEDLLTSL